MIKLNNFTKEMIKLDNFTKMIKLDNFTDIIKYFITIYYNKFCINIL